ncbi:MAG: hypothetical protein HON23_03230, partial [Rickettsiales bacterium]|nr:hypothetical protein [Rickettsiales bacterium]
VAALGSPNCKVTNINLGHNQIGAAGAEALAAALGSPNCKVTNINLYDNKIGAAGAQALAAALGSPNCKVTNIDLYDNQIGAAGAQALASALGSTNCKVTNIHLGGNQIGDAGAQALAAALGSPNCKVTNIELRGNQIGDAGAQALAAALGSPNCKVTNISLRSNQIGDSLNRLIFGLIEARFDQNKKDRLFLHWAMSEKHGDIVKQVLRSHKINMANSVYDTWTVINHFYYLNKKNAEDYVKANGTILRFLNPEFRTDPDILRASFTNSLFQLIEAQIGRGYLGKYIFSYDLDDLDISKLLTQENINRPYDIYNNGRLITPLSAALEREAAERLKPYKLTDDEKKSRTNNLSLLDALKAKEIHSFDDPMDRMVYKYMSKDTRQRTSLIEELEELLSIEQDSKQNLTIKDASQWNECDLILYAYAGKDKEIKAFFQTRPKEFPMQKYIYAYMGFELGRFPTKAQDLHKQIKEKLALRLEIEAAIPSLADDHKRLDDALISARQEFYENLMEKVARLDPKSVSDLLELLRQRDSKAIFAFVQQRFESNQELEYLVRYAPNLELLERRGAASEFLNFIIVMQSNISARSIAVAAVAAEEKASQANTRAIAAEEQARLARSIADTVALGAEEARVVATSVESTVDSLGYGKRYRELKSEIASNPLLERFYQDLEYGIATTLFVTGIADTTSLGRVEVLGTEEVSAAKKVARVMVKSVISAPFELPGSKTAHEVASGLGGIAVDRTDKFGQYYGRVAKLLSEHDKMLSVRVAQEITDKYSDFILTGAIEASSIFSSKGMNERIREFYTDSKRGFIGKKLGHHKLREMYPKADWFCRAIFHAIFSDKDAPEFPGLDQKIAYVLSVAEPEIDKYLVKHSAEVVETGASPLHEEVAGGGGGGGIGDSTSAKSILDGYARLSGVRSNFPTRSEEEAAENRTSSEALCGEDQGSRFRRRSLSRARQAAEVDTSVESTVDSLGSSGGGGDGSTWLSPENLEAAARKELETNSSGAAATDTQLWQAKVDTTVLGSAAEHSTFPPSKGVE